MSTKPSLETLYDEWCKLANEFQTSIPAGNNEQLEWRMDRAFMRFIKEFESKGGKIDRAAVKRCIDREVQDE